MESPGLNNFMISGQKADESSADFKPASSK